MSAIFATFGIDWHLLLAQGFNFIVVAALLTWFLYKPVMRMVAERERFIAEGVENAEEATRKLARADAEADKRVDLAQTQADGIVKNARGSASSERTKILRDAEARAADVAKEAEARAAEIAARAGRESEKEIARLALLAAEKVLRSSGGTNARAGTTP